MDDRILIEARGITKTFPGVRALDNVDFELRAGETHILLGENGAGKSTLTKTLSGAYAPDEGEVSIDGQRVALFDPRVAQRMGVSIIYQEMKPPRGKPRGGFIGQAVPRKIYTPIKVVLAADAAKYDESPEVLKNR